MKGYPYEKHHRREAYTDPRRAAAPRPAPQFQALSRLEGRSRQDRKKEKKRLAQECGRCRISSLLSPDMFSRARAMRARRWSGSFVRYVGSANNTPPQGHLDASLTVQRSNQRADGWYCLYDFVQTIEGSKNDSMLPTSQFIRQPYSRPSHTRPDRPSSAGKKQFLHQTIRGTTGRAPQATSSTRDRETKVEYRNKRKRKRKKQNRR